MAACGMPIATTTTILSYYYDHRDYTDCQHKAKKCQNMLKQNKYKMAAELLLSGHVFFNIYAIYIDTTIFIYIDMIQLFMISWMVYFNHF